MAQIKEIGRTIRNGLIATAIAFGPIMLPDNKSRVLAHDDAGTATPQASNEFLFPEDKLLAEMGMPEDGHAIVGIDESIDTICIKARLGQGIGSSCNFDLEYTLNLSSSDESGRVLKAIADPQERIGGMIAYFPDSSARSFPSHDNGVLVYGVLHEEPEKLVVVGKNAETLVVFLPAEARTPIPEPTHDLLAGIITP